MNQENSTKQKGNPFRWVLPLQHMANVKIVEALWRNSTVRDKWKYTDLHSELNNSHFHLMCDSLEEKVDKLLVPDAIKDELKVFVIEMVRVALNWLKNVSGVLTEYREDEHYLPIIAHFIDNFSWENNGLADGRKMFQSYVSNKETISFNIWRNLCDYCIEDDIIRFSKTIDWRNGFRDSSIHAIYWYWRIYGKCPTREMFSYNAHYSLFEKLYFRGGQFDENKLIKDVLEKSVESNFFPADITAVKYFHNQPAYKALLDEILRRKEDDPLPSASFVHILEQMKDTERIKQICSSQKSVSLFTFLAEWPWNMFPDRWNKIFEDSSVLPRHFLDFFQRVFINTSFWEHYKLRESEYKLIYNRTACPHVMEVWAFLKQRFGVDDYATHMAFIVVFEMRDITCCKILFDDVELTQRISFLRILEDPGDTWMIGLNNEDFCNKFLEEVLRSEEEREIFLKVVNCRRLGRGLEWGITT